MWRLNDLFGSIPAHPAELLSVIAFDHLDQIRRRARAVVEADRALLANAFAQSECQAFSTVRTEHGTTSFPRLKKGNVDDFLARLRQEHDTSAVSGHFFGMPDHFRIGMGVNAEMFEEGLRRIALAAQ
jgi:aspartate/methionine/tyrosine aminotransferase